jgi:lipid A ethanolaminephosphotransferase
VASTDATPAQAVQNARMALKLFHTTGYSTLLQPGETRVAPHPARLVLVASLWVALACNVALWRWLAGSGDGRSTVAAAAVLGGGTCLFLSLFAGRRMLKIALTLVLLAGALIATGLWSQHLPVATLWQGPPRTWLPAWASFLRWQVLLLMLVLAVLPIVSMWNASARRLSARSQLLTSIAGIFAGLLLSGAGFFLA